VVKARPMADALMASTRDFNPAPLIAEGQMYAAQTAVLRMLYNNPGEAALLDAETPIPNGLRHLIWTEAAFVTLPEMGYALSEGDMVVYQAALADAAQETQGLQHLMFAGAPMAAMSGLTFTTEDRLAGMVLLYGLLRVNEAVAFQTAPPESQALARQTATDTLMQADEALAHRAICTASCGDDVPACVMALWSMGGGKDAAVTLNTPLDMLIPEDRFQGSARHQGEVIRVARSNLAKRSAAGLEACAVAVVTAPSP
jgi:hypothetical protein